MDMYNAYKPNSYSHTFSRSKLQYTLTKTVDQDKETKK